MQIAVFAVFNKNICDHEKVFKKNIDKSVVKVYNELANLFQKGEKS